MPFSSGKSPVEERPVAHDDTAQFYLREGTSRRVKFTWTHCDVGR